MAALPLGALPSDTAEYMLGRVAVTPVFLESDGSLDPNTENWTAEHKAEVFARIQEGLDWWVDLLAKHSPVHTLQWVYDTTWIDSPAPSRYEPISRPSNDFAKWVGEFLTDAGFGASSSLETNMRAFNHSQREKLGTDWSFTIFVPNAQRDPDGAFASGGSFTNAFAFAGGLFEVVPSKRPASTFAHETGHIFYARDEYSGGGNYYQRRGYYDSQNTNALDQNPTPQFQQQPSIMASGSALATAYQNVETAAPALAQIGWQDSDGDGIFDVLDVPLGLTGGGIFGAGGGEFLFSGRAFAQTLANANSSGTGSSITLNRVTEVQYRFAGDDAWVTLRRPDSQDTPIELRVAVAPGDRGRAVELRAVDSRTGISSEVRRFQAGGARQIIAEPGIAGLAWDDADGDGVFDTGEAARQGWQVVLTAADGAPLASMTAVNPDAQPVGPVHFGQLPGVEVRDVWGDGGTGIAIGASQYLGGRALRPFLTSSGRTLDGWNGPRELSVEPVAPFSRFAIEYASISSASTVRVRGYDPQGQLLFSRTVPVAGVGGRATLELDDAAGRLGSVRLRVLEGVGEFGEFSFGRPATAAVDASGRFQFDAMPPGDFRLTLAPPRDIYGFTTAAGATYQVSFGPGDRLTGLDFGTTLPPDAWRNPVSPLDLSGDGMLTPLDLLRAINALNTYGSGSLEVLPVPVDSIVDANGDRLLTPLDALVIINGINARRRFGGEAERAESNAGTDGPAAADMAGSSLRTPPGASAFDAALAAVDFGDILRRRGG